MNGNIDTEVRRFPRPMGTTALAIEYSKNRTEENLFKLFNYVIHQWLLTNGLFGGTYMDVNTLSLKSGIPRDYIQTYMREQVMSSKVWDRTRQEDIINGLLGQQMAWALEDRLEINQQADILRASQGGKYTPFISAELNKVLKLKLESSTGLQSVIRSLMGGGTTNIFAMFNQQNNVTETQQGISVEDARRIVMESQLTLDDKSKEAKLIETNYDINSFPVVVATEQEGVSAADYGGSFNNNQQELQQITDDYKGSIESASREHHEMRREIEQRIDPDAEDPEMWVELNDEQYQEPEPASFAQQFLKS